LFVVANEQINNIDVGRRVAQRCGIEQINVAEVRNLFEKNDCCFSNSSFIVGRSYSKFLWINFETCVVEFSF
jgi:hypothetical protein